MGSHTFRVDLGGVRLTPQDAYNELVEAAQWEYGKDAYNGSISTTQGLFMVKAEPNEISKVIEKILDDDSHTVEKWGPAGCIELTGSALESWKRSRSDLRGKHGVRAYMFFGWAAS